MLLNGFTVLDVETSYQLNSEGKSDPTPYHPANRLVSVGYRAYAFDREFEDYLCFFHTQQEPTYKVKETLQQTLDHTSLLIGHNIKFDLGWLLECGFIYEGKLWDTMVVEYVLSRGVKRPLDLDSVLKRYGLPGKEPEIEKYMEEHISFENIPWPLVEKYGLRDIRGTEEVFLKQLGQLNCSMEDIL